MRFPHLIQKLVYATPHGEGTCFNIYKHCVDFCIFQKIVYCVPRYTGIHWNTQYSIHTINQIRNLMFLKKVYIYTSYKKPLINLNGALGDGSDK